MASFSKVMFTDICLNSFLLVDTDLQAEIKECALSQPDGRDCLLMTFSDDVIWEVDISKSLAEFKYTIWDREAEIEPIIDLTITVRSVPSWMVSYTTAPRGCLQWMFATLRIKDSRVNYLGFITDLLAFLSPSQCQRLPLVDSLAVWKTRSASRVKNVKGVNILPPRFQSFSSKDLDRLKGRRKWLTDSHVTFCLLDSYRHYRDQKIWGDLKITLLDTIFWEKMSVDPDAYHDKYREKVDLVGYDFVVMPMFGNEHWRLGIIENPAEFLQGKTSFHILDSFPGLSWGHREGNQLEKILLKHFPEAAPQKGRITTNWAQVPHQPNGYDCGCFLIFFAQTFFSNPGWTMTVIKRSFSSSADRLAGWGLETDDLSFVRNEMKVLLLKYIKQGDAVVEYKA